MSDCRSTMQVNYCTLWDYWCLYKRPRKFLLRARRLFDMFRAFQIRFHSKIFADQPWKNCSTFGKQSRTWNATINLIKFYIFYYSFKSKLARAIINKLVCWANSKLNLNKHSVVTVPGEWLFPIDRRIWRQHCQINWRNSHISWKWQSFTDIFLKTDLIKRQFNRLLFG